MCVCVGGGGGGWSYMQRLVIISVSALDGE